MPRGAVPSTPYKIRFREMDLFPEIFSLDEARKLAPSWNRLTGQTVRFFLQEGEFQHIVRGIYGRTDRALIYPDIAHVATIYYPDGYLSGDSVLHPWKGQRSESCKIHYVVSVDKRILLCARSNDMVSIYQSFGLGNYRNRIRSVYDGGRRIRVATLERAIFDILVLPTIAPGPDELLPWLRNHRKRIKQKELLELALDYGRFYILKGLEELAWFVGLKWLEKRVIQHQLLWREYGGPPSFMHIQ